MKIKKLFSKRKRTYSNNKPRVRNSYYTFAREYPAGNIPIERRIHLKLKSKSAKKNLFLISMLILLAVSFFSVRLALDISYKTPDVVTPGNVQLGDTENPRESILQTDGFRALYMPYEHLGDTAYIRSFIKEIQRKDCNGVVIDFKTENGKLCYSSLNSYAIANKCAIFDNNTVRQALSLFKKENITVAARIFCFLDNTLPQNSPELAVKYMDTDVNWIDTTIEGDGKTWLNPCSKDALYYLLDIINELQSFSINGFILEKCHFPDSDNTGGASFPGENQFKNKNTVLRLFIREVKNSLPPDCFLVITQDATDSLNGNDKLYFGEINSADFDGVASYTINRPADCILDKKTDFTSMMVLYSAISDNFEEKTFLPVIDISEYSGKYIRTIRKNEINSFILYDETGEY